MSTARRVIRRSIAIGLIVVAPSFTSLPKLSRTQSIVISQMGPSSVHVERTWGEFRDTVDFTFGHVAGGVHSEGTYRSSKGGELHYRAEVTANEGYVSIPEISAQEIFTVVADVNQPERFCRSVPQRSRSSDGTNQQHVARPIFQLSDEADPLSAPPQQAFQSTVSGEECQILPPFFEPLECDLSGIQVLFCESGNAGDNSCWRRLLDCNDRCNAAARSQVQSLRNNIEANIISACLACCFTGNPAGAAACYFLTVAVMTQLFVVECARIRADYNACQDDCAGQYCECSG